MIASVNVWFLHCPNQRIMQPNKKFVQFKTILAQIADSLVNTAKRPVRRLSVNNVQPPSNVYHAQGNPSCDTRKDGVDHALKRNEK